MSARLKISFLILNLGVRGSVRRVVELSNRLLQRGHDVTVYHETGEPCSWLPLNAPTLPAEEIASRKHDAVIYFGNTDHHKLIKSIRAGVKAFYLLGMNEYAPNLVDMLLGKIPPFPGDSRMRVMVEIVANPKDYLLLSNCTAMTQWLRDRVNVEAVTVLGAVNHDVFYPRAVGGKIDTMILAGGAPREIEGTADVLEAVKLVKEVYPAMKLQTYARRGFSQDELANLYSSAAVFLDAQTHGGWNNPVAEALACQCPVVCTDIWGNKDFAFHEKTALIVPVHDTRAMADAILRILALENYELVRDMQGLGRETILKFDWDDSAIALERAIKSRLNGA